MVEACQLMTEIQTNIMNKCITKITNILVLYTLGLNLI